MGDNYTQGETCGGKPNPQQEAFRQNPKAAFFGGGPYQTVYCDQTTGQWVGGRIAKAGVDYARDDQLIAPGQTGYNEQCRYDKPGFEPQWNADGTVTYKRLIGTYWDPIAQVCRGGSVEG